MVNGPALQAWHDLLGVHLHRYLAPVLLEFHLESLWVITGFEGSARPSLTLELRQESAVPSYIGLDFQRLAASLRSGAQRVSLHLASGQRLAALAVFAGAEPSAPHLHAFVVTDQLEALANPELEQHLCRRVNEAIRATRHNALRMLFDEADTYTLKEFLDAVLGRLPDLCGCDHSAALILSSNLEAMVMAQEQPATFEIVAEHLYVQPPASDPTPYTPLIGMELATGNTSDAGLLGYAFKETQREGQVGVHLFVAEGQDDTWIFLGEASRVAPRFATQVRRPMEQMTALIPLLSRNEVGRNELLGFLSINYQAPLPMSALTSTILETLAMRLANFLRRSPMFSLSAQQLWLLEEVRQAYHLAMAARDDKEARLRHFIGAANRAVATTTTVPCFAIGYVITDDQAQRHLRFVEPHGFTFFRDIDLPVDACQVQQSSIATLAVRLNRPLSLTGATTAVQDIPFQDHCWVNEKQRALLDARRVAPPTDTDAWLPLRDYYKASRDVSYATIAFPIRAGEEVLGVIAVEVDRDTDWLWWTGFGSYLFYRLLANEIAADLHLLGL